MTRHIPVLFDETIDMLDLHEGDVVVDGTVNAGGHSREIAERIGEDGHLIGIDRDADALKLAAENLENAKPKVTLLEGNYRNMAKLLGDAGIEKVDAILLDIGLSNRQLEDSGRGFTYTKDEPLMMTFDTEQTEDSLTAREIVNNWEEENIADIIYNYGDERFARRIARAIVTKREEIAIDTTFQLAEIISEAVPNWYKAKKIHPATKTFQAIRITVNDELRALKDGIHAAIEILKEGGRLAIITFHSGEDRIVKNEFKSLDKEGVAKVLTKKPIAPSDTEIKNNPKSRSSKLRVIEKK